MLLSESKSHMLFIAEFEPQVWQNNYAVPVDPQGPIGWDCTAAVRKYIQDDGTLGKPFRKNGDEYLDVDDVLKNDPAAPAWIQDWSGPFTITVRPN